MLEFLLYDLILRVFLCCDLAARYKWAEMLKYLNFKVSYSLSLVHNEEPALPNCLHTTHYIVLAALLGHAHLKQEEVIAWVIWEGGSFIGAYRISLSFVLQPSLNKFGTLKQLHYLFSVFVNTDYEWQMLLLVRC